MILRSLKAPIILLLGDILVLFTSLWLALTLRHLALPEMDLLIKHILPFGIIFIFWLIFLFIYDLYNLRLIIWRFQLKQNLIKAQIINMAIAIAFFYFIPYFSITPKTNLFIFLIISFVALLAWRLLWGKYWFSHSPEEIIFTTQGKEAEEIRRVLKQETNHQISDSSLTDLNLQKQAIVVIDATHPEVDNLYPWLFSEIRFIDIGVLYEELFGRIPLDLISGKWLLDNISSQTKTIYDSLKRFSDIILALFLGLISLPLYLIIILLIYFFDGRPIFFSQKRVGRLGQVFNLLKFRTMVAEEVTALGVWLRKTRLDELPQLYNVLRGDLSLIGPRPEKPDYVGEYRQEIEYYNIRHLISPGLSGWAQIYHENHSHFSLSTASTREKLSFDLYYLKHRSLLFDLKIILKTIRILLSRQGR